MRDLIAGGCGGIVFFRIGAAVSQADRRTLMIRLAGPPKGCGPGRSWPTLVNVRFGDAARVRWMTAVGAKQT
jgi:hypothetical protein